MVLKRIWFERMIVSKELGYLLNGFEVSKEKCVWWVNRATTFIRDGYSDKSYDVVKQL